MAYKLIDTYVEIPGGVFVAHVKSGYEDRQMHIDKMLGDAGIAFEYMLDGDIPDITETRRSKYFSPVLEISLAAQSCALKHLLIYEQIVNRNLPGALVLEDDICLGRKFPQVFGKSMEEIHNCVGGGNPLIISYEDTRLRYVERSRRVWNQVLYAGDRDRFAGCYYINYLGAKMILDYLKEHPLDRPIDLLHHQLLQSGRLAYYWSHPTVATQGSHSGLFRSGICTNKKRITEWKWRLRRQYRRLLYSFR